MRAGKVQYPGWCGTLDMPDIEGGGVKWEGTWMAGVGKLGWGSEGASAIRISLDMYALAPNYLP